MDKKSFIFVVAAALCSAFVGARAEAQYTVQNQTLVAGFEQTAAEGPNSTSWITTGNAGFDYGAGFSHSGANNGWIRNSTGWNALTSRQLFLPGGKWGCISWVWIRTSGNVSGFYFSTLNPSGGIVHEVGPYTSSFLYSWPNWRQVGDTYSVVGPTNLRVRFGFWGNGQDAWVQADDVKIDCRWNGY